MSMNAMPDVHTLTGAYVCDALAPAEREAFEQHLAQCAACRGEVAELREVAAVLGTAVAQQPPARLKALVDARIEVTRQLPPETTEGSGGASVIGADAYASGAAGAASRRSDPVDGAVGTVTAIDQAARRRRARVSRPALAGWAAAAVLAGVVAGLGVHAADQQSQINALSQRATAMQQVLSASDVHSGSAALRTGGTAALIDSRSRDEAVISFTGISAPPPGKAYQLWMIGPSGARSGGLLSVPAAGNPNPVVAHQLGDATNIAVTVEPAHGSPQPSTAPIVLLPMGT